MAAPVIVSVTPSSSTLNPGQFVDVTVVASDPDSSSGSVTFPVTDGQGNTSNASLTLNITDPLTFGTGTSSLNVTVVKTSNTATSAVYRVTAL